MCDICGKYEKTGKAHLISVGAGLIEFARERSFEEIVKTNGCLLVATQNKDYDKEGNFIGDYSEFFAKAEKYVKKYNPEKLSIEVYQELYSKEKLPWQNQ